MSEDISRSFDALRVPTRADRAVTEALTGSVKREMAQ